MRTWQNFTHYEGPISHNRGVHTIENPGLKILNVDLHQVHMHGVALFVVIEASCFNFKFRRAFSGLPAVGDQRSSALQIQSLLPGEKESRTPGLARQGNVLATNAAFQMIQSDVPLESLKDRWNRFKGDDLETWIPQRPQHGVVTTVCSDIDKGCDTF